METAVYDDDDDDDQQLAQNIVTGADGWKWLPNAHTSNYRIYITLHTV